VKKTTKKHPLSNWSITRAELKELDPCAYKWKEFLRNTPKGKKRFSARDIAEASGPHGLYWVLSELRLDVPPALDAWWLNSLNVGDYDSRKGATPEERAEISAGWEVIDNLWPAPKRRAKP